MKKIIDFLKNIKIGKTKKIIIAAVAAVLCIATVLLVVFCNVQHPLERFAEKIMRKQNFKMDVVISGIPLFGSVFLSYEVDGNIHHIPSSDASESYFEVVGDTQYKYTQKENGTWTKEETDENLLSNLINNELFQELINSDNYELVEGEKNVYRQKSDVVFDGCKNVTITIEKNACTIEMVTLSDGMALDTMIVISDIGKINLKLPVVE